MAITPWPEIESSASYQALGPAERVRVINAWRDHVLEQAPPDLTASQREQINTFARIQIEGLEEQDRGFFDDIRNAFQRGLTSATTTREVVQIMSGSDEKENFEQLSEALQRQQQLPASDVLTEFQQTKTFGEGFNVFLRNPIQVISELSAESMGALLPIASVTATAGLVGGSFLPGIGNISGAGGGFALGVGLASGSVEFAGKIIDVFRSLKVDVTNPEQLEAAFQDDALLDEARNLAFRKGIPIGIFDAVSAGIAGKLIAKPGLTLAKKIGAGAGEVAIQSTLGAAGEFTGQVSAGEPLSPPSILGEALAEFGPGTGEIVVGAARETLARPVEPGTTPEGVPAQPLTPEQQEELEREVPQPRVFNTTDPIPPLKLPDRAGVIGSTDEEVLGIARANQIEVVNGVPIDQMDASQIDQLRSTFSNAAQEPSVSGVFILDNKDGQLQPDEVVTNDPLNVEVAGNFPATPEQVMNDAEETREGNVSYKLRTRQLHPTITPTAPQVFRIMKDKELISRAFDQLEAPGGVDAARDRIMAPGATLHEAALDNVLAGILVANNKALQQDAITAGDTFTVEFLERENLRLVQALGRRGHSGGLATSAFRVVYSFLKGETQLRGFIDDAQSLIFAAKGDRVLGLKRGLNVTADEIMKAILEPEQSLETIGEVSTTVRKNKAAKDILKRSTGRAQPGKRKPINERLRDRILSALKRQDPKAPDLETQVLNILFEKAQEFLPEQNQIKQKATDAAELIKLSFQFPEIMREVFAKARDKVTQELAQRPTQFNISSDIGSFLEAAIKEGFAVEQVKKLTTQELKARDIDLDNLIRSRFADQVDQITSFSVDIAEGLGVSPEDAETLQRMIAQELGGRVSEKKRTALERILGARSQKAPRKDQKLIDKLVELSNLGALDSDAWSEAMAERFNLPTIDAAFRNQAKALFEQRDAAVQASSPESIQVREIDFEIAKLMKKKAGITTREKATAIFYSSILSGPQTLFLTNPVGSGFKLASDVFTEATLAITSKGGLKPQDIRFAMARLLRGLAVGKDLARELIATGIQPARFDVKFPDSDVLEYDPFEALTFLNKSGIKYVRRFMRAGDEIFYNAGREAGAAFQALRDARAEGFTGQAALNEAGRRLGVGEEEVALAKARQEPGIKNERQARIRAQEIIEEDRTMSVRAEGHHFGEHGTYNYPSVGFLGFLSDAFRKMGNIWPAAKTIVPFTQIVANVTNDSLNFVPPVAIKRALKGRGGATQEQTEIEAARHLSQAGQGMVIFSAAMLVNLAYQDDEDAPYISGPLSRDFRKRNQLRGDGWRPYHFKIGDRQIPYWNTPLVVPLGIIGAWSDSMRFDNEDPGNRLNEIALMLAVAPVTVLDQSFLSGLSDFLGAITEGTGESKIRKVQRILARTSSSFVVPNAFKQLSRIVDPQVFRDDRRIELTFLAQVPVLNRTLKKRLNVLGDPVKTDRPVLDTTPVFTNPDPVENEQSQIIFDYVVRKRAWLPTPSPYRTRHISSTQLTAAEKRQPKIKALLEGENVMDPDQYHAMIELRGSKFKQKFFRPGVIEKLERLERGEPAHEAIKKIMAEAQTEAKRELLGLPPVRTRRKRASFL